MNMQIENMQYTHTVIGFPHVKLKIFEDRRDGLTGWITIKGKIFDKPFFFKDKSGIEVKSSGLLCGASKVGHDFEEAVQRFDTWVRETFAEDASVQG